jgi:ADP-heptose:LPS heptosyltransferase
VKYEIFYCGFGVNLNKYFFLNLLIRSSKKIKFIDYCIIANKNKYNHRLEANSEIYKKISKNVLNNTYTIPYINTNKSIHICIHVGSDSNQAFKRWPLSNWIQLIYDIKNLNSDIVLLIILGPAESMYAEHFPSNLVLINPSFSNLVNIISSSKLFISADSGIAHLASSLNITTFTIFGATDDKIFSPLNNNKIIKISKSLPCQPCVPFGQFGCEDQPCMKNIPVKLVFDHITKFLNSN